MYCISFLTIYLFLLFEMTLCPIKNVRNRVFFSGLFYILFCIGTECVPHDQRCLGHFNYWWPMCVWKKRENVFMWVYCFGFQFMLFSFSLRAHVHLGICVHMCITSSRVITAKMSSEIFKTFLFNAQTSTRAFFRLTPAWTPPSPSSTSKPKTKTNLKTSPTPL